MPTAEQDRGDRGAVRQGVTILTPTEYVGTLMELCQSRRGEMQKMEYLSEDASSSCTTLPLAEIVSTSSTR
jgi:GTP-binding protein LepA